MSPEDFPKTGSVSETLETKDLEADVPSEPTPVELADLYQVGNFQPEINKNIENFAIDLRKAQEKLHTLSTAGLQSSAEYLVLSNKLLKVENGQTVWKSEGEIDESKLHQSLEYFERQNITNQGRGLLMRMYTEGKGNSADYITLHQELATGSEWKDPATIDIAKLRQLVTVESPVISPAEAETGFQAEDSSEVNIQPETAFTSKMQEREVVGAERMSAREASKQFLSAERMRLAEELRAERKAQRERLGVLKAAIEVAETTSEDGEPDREYGGLAETQSVEATAIAGRLVKGELTEADAAEERVILNELLATGTSMDGLKNKLEAHYAKADAEAQRQFESIQKTVEQVLIRNNVFIVHSFLLNEELRHNENSNIDKRATIEDDIDTLLSLEPSISTSSVVPGTRQGLWSESVGVIIGGGDIRGVAGTDNGTLTGGIKYRNGNISSSEEIDGKVSDKKDRGYNELVVNNPKVFGFYSTVKFTESGELLGFNSGGNDAENIRNKNRFMENIDLANKKGMPSLIMTPDRYLFEFVSIGKDGKVTVGAEITPEQVARGNAGLSSEDRLALGENVIKKNLFTSIETQREAKMIIAGLEGQDESQVEFTRDEYLAYALDTKGKVWEFPESLRGDKEFMLEVAEVNPISAYENATESLKRDLEFIKQIYALRSGVRNEHFIYYNIPVDLKKDESIALLAIEHDDYGELDISLADSPKVWGEIVNKIVAKSDPDSWFSREVGKDQVSSLYLIMKDGDKEVDVSLRMRTPEVMSRLNTAYPKYKFELYNTQDILVTKLSE